MARLFQEMVETPHVLTRAYFVKLYEDSVIQDFADNDFNGFADPGAHHTNPAPSKPDPVE